MKQLYGTVSAMNRQAQLMIKKDGDMQSIEIGQQGCISAIEGLQLRIYGIKITTDQSLLTIPIIFIQDFNTLLELNAVAFTRIKQSPTTEAKGIVQISDNSTELIIYDCIFEDITIEGHGGIAIRIENDQENSFDATIEGTQFNNIN
ncbi:MAG: hypothetical protein EZS28_034050 [Streblomastix strix]|uniref:Right handed beta helix domain-containing protein n=1 Tax=Streblomastix strix TaxID=222440 RepID=A0A5J4UKB7_9EUKA|nr:MAG: hypothetical protein EZS28_034050 [Streblomastix strix]